MGAPENKSPRWTFRCRKELRVSLTALRPLVIVSARIYILYRTQNVYLAHSGRSSVVLSGSTPANAGYFFPLRSMQPPPAVSCPCSCYGSGRTWCPFINLFIPILDDRPARHQEHLLSLYLLQALASIPASGAMIMPIRLYNPKALCPCSYPAPHACSASEPCAEPVSFECGVERAGRGEGEGRWIGGKCQMPCSVVDK